MTPKMKLEARLKPAMAPQLQQALMLMQLGPEAMLSHIREEAMENPLISLDALYRSPASFRHEEIAEHLEIPDERGLRSLKRALRDQIPGSLGGSLRQTLKKLIDFLDEDGYLRFSLEELESLAGIAPAEAEEALRLLQAMEPLGVGASSLEECLLLQLQADPDSDPLAAVMVRRYLKDIAAGRLRRIAETEGVPLPRVEQAAERIRNLNPFPANGFDNGRRERPVLPEIRVFRENGMLKIELTENALPPLKKNRVYEEMLEEGQDAETQAYLREKNADYSRLETAIALRARTLTEVTKCIVRHQEAFFLDGNAALTPLTLEDIAAEVHVHVSTAARALQHKYLDCEWGVFPLRHFLSRYTAAKAESGGPVLSQSQLKERIRELIDSEDKHQPLSDEALAAVLRQEGFSVPRRTVSEYRKRLGIPGSYQRKEKT